MDTSIVTIRNSIFKANIYLEENKVNCLKQFDFDSERK